MDGSLAVQLDTLVHRFAVGRALGNMLLAVTATDADAVDDIGGRPVRRQPRGAMTLRLPSSAPDSRILLVLKSDRLHLLDVILRESCMIGHATLTSAPNC